MVSLQAPDKQALELDPPAALLAANKGGFSFDNVKRNEFLVGSGRAMPKALKTGTTIAGILFKGGVVLGADTRSTEGSIVADKNCKKIHHISKTIWCCGAGTAADTENVTAMVSSQLELHRMSTGREPRVITAKTRLKNYLFRYQGYVSAALVLGGVDSQGAHLHTVFPHGSTDSLPFVTMGSGSLAAMAVFEKGYKDDLDEKEAMDLVDQAIQAGIFNDMGSGSNVDLMVIREDGTVTEHRGYQQFSEKKFKKEYAKFPRGTTDIVKETRTLMKDLIQVSEVRKPVAASS
jgi:20S proteasome subunit beta 2